MINKFMIKITPFNDQRMIHLYLPDDYYISEEKYPVIYMYDGHNLFFDQDATYGKCWGMKDFLDYYDKKFIVVGMECNHQGNERLNEYCPYTLPNSYLGDINGKGKEYMDWVVEELKPYIDSNYRTNPFRECTMIAGSSMGGLMSIYTIVKYNNIFSKAACLSSAIGLCMNELRKEIEINNIEQDTKVYLDFGSEEARNKTGLTYMVSNNLEIAHLLSLKGSQVYPKIVVKGHHNEATWEKQIPEFMEYLWK